MEGPPCPGHSVYVPFSVSRTHSLWTLFSRFPVTRGRSSHVTAWSAERSERGPPAAPSLGPQSPSALGRREGAILLVWGRHSKTLCLLFPLRRRGKWGVSNPRGTSPLVPQVSSWPGCGAGRHVAASERRRFSIRISGLLPVGRKLGLLEGDAGLLTACPGG